MTHDGHFYYFVLLTKLLVNRFNFIVSVVYLHLTNTRSNFYRGRYCCWGKKQRFTNHQQIKMKNKLQLTRKTLTFTKGHKQDSQNRLRSPMPEGRESYFQ